MVGVEQDDKPGGGGIMKSGALHKVMGAVGGALSGFETGYIPGAIIGGITGFKGDTSSPAGKAFNWMGQLQGANNMASGGAQGQSPAMGNDAGNYSPTNPNDSAMQRRMRNMQGQGYGGSEYA